MIGSGSSVSPVMRYPKRHATVLGKRMAYVEAGQGDPIVFLHGNVTSSFMWRNVIPHLEDLGRCIAIDNIGQGDSEKLQPSGPGSYRLAEHQRYVDGLLAVLNVERNVTFVLHDWGSQIGFTWAYDHPEAVKGIAYAQALVGNFAWDQWPPEVQALFKRFRSPEGEELVLQQNFFVERILPAMVMRELTEAEMEEYRRPYRNPGEDRRPTLAWPRELPIESEPSRCPFSSSQLLMSGRTRKNKPIPRGKALPMILNRWPRPIAVMPGGGQRPAGRGYRWPLNDPQPVGPTIHPTAPIAAAPPTTRPAFFRNCRLEITLGSCLSFSSFDIAPPFFKLSVIYSESAATP